MSSSLLKGLKIETKAAKPKSEPKVYHLVWDRYIKGADGKFTKEPTRLSVVLAKAMTVTYGQNVDPTNINTGAAKAFLETLLVKVTE